MPLQSPLLKYSISDFSNNNKELFTCTLIHNGETKIHCDYLFIHHILRSFIMKYTISAFFQCLSSISSAVFSSSAACCLRNYWYWRYSSLVISPSLSSSYKPLFLVCLAFARHSFIWDLIRPSAPVFCWQPATEETAAGKHIYLLFSASLFLLPVIP